MYHPSVNFKAMSLWSINTHFCILLSDKMKMQIISSQSVQAEKTHIIIPEKGDTMSQMSHIKSNLLHDTTPTA